MTQAGAWPPAPCPGAGRRLWATLRAVAPQHPFGDERAQDFVEVFAGSAVISSGLRSLGFRGASLDLRTSAHHDVLTPSGVLLLLQQVLLLRPGGILWRAPPCSTWVFMSRGSTGRSMEQPWGNAQSPYILSQDALVDRLVLALEVATARGAWWIVEQPATTLMWEYPSMRACLSRHGLAPVRLDMGAYGGGSQKPTHLVGTAPYLGQLARRCSAADVEHLRVHGVATAHQYTDAQGQKRCQGSSQLKATQAYPIGFGDAHALQFQQGGANVPSGTDGPSGSRDARAHVADPSGSRDPVEEVLRGLPAAVRRSCGDAWWLRDLLPGGPQFSSRPERERLHAPARRRSRSRSLSSSGSPPW